MENSKSSFQFAKLAPVVFALILLSLCVVGCDTGDKPSKMVEMRGQMMKQREEMKKNNNGNTAPGAPATSASGN